MLLLRILTGRPRFVAGAVAGIATALVLPHALSRLTRGIVAWDFGCVVFMVLATILFSGERDIVHDAAAQEEGEWTVFWITVGAVVASFAAMLGEFATSKDAAPGARDLHTALVGGTLFLSWLVTHTIFTLRYAHEYYGTTAGKVDAGLEFPGTDAPDYWDFFYFSIVLGMTFQVSDVQITSRKLRKLATVHGLLSFLFNTVVVALTVNIGASLLQS